MTGAGSGMGRASAFALADRGTGVGFVDIDHDAAEATAAGVRERGVPAVAVGADVSRRVEVESAFDAVVDGGCSLNGC